MTNKKETEKLLPQSYPMIMIDNLIESDTKKTITKFTVKKDNIFVHENRLKEAGIIENMAQTAAARAGYDAITNNLKVKKGYIGAIKNLVIYSLPEVNESIQTTLTPVSDIGNISVVKTEIFSGKEKIAECTMTIILEN